MTAQSASKKLGLATRKYRKLGVEIAQLREHLGLSQQQLADHMHANRSQIAAWETGVHKPSPERLIQLGNIAGDLITRRKFWERAGIHPEKLGGMTSVKVDASPGGHATLEIPVRKDPWDSGASNTISISTDRIPGSASLFAVEFRERSPWPSAVGDKDLIVVEGAERSVFALRGKPVLVLFDAFPSVLQYWNPLRPQPAPTLREDDLSYEELDRAGYPSPGLEARRPGYLAGWVTEHRAISDWPNWQPHPVSNPWKIVLQLEAKRPYVGAYVDLTAWQEDKSVSAAPGAPHPPLALRKAARLWGEIVAWFGCSSPEREEELVNGE